MIPRISDIVPRAWGPRVRACFAMLCVLGACGLIRSDETAAQEAAAPLVLMSEFHPLARPVLRTIFPTFGEAPEIDASPYDRCWREAIEVEIASDMPGGGISRRTLAKICRDARYLYIAFDCREPAIDKLPLAENPQPDVWQDENIHICIAPARSRDFFVFSVDPNEAQYEWSARQGVAYAADWKVSVLRHTQGWRGEVAIPLAGLAVDQDIGGEMWRFNFGRDIHATGEQGSWVPTAGNRFVPLQWGRMFFGALDEFDKRPAVRRMALVPLRWTLGPRDFVLRVLVRIDVPAKELAGMHLRVSAIPGDPADPRALEPVAFQTLALKDRLAALVLNARALPAGQFILFAELLNAENIAVLQSRTLLSKAAADTPADSAAQPPRRLILELTPIRAKGSAAAAWPITTGVVLPKGALLSPDNTRLLDPSGKEAPVQCVARSRWPSDGSIRWLGLDFQANLLLKPPIRYELEYGPGIVPMVVTTGFKRDPDRRHLPFEQVRGEWGINTGPLLFNIQTNRFTGLGEAWMDVDGNGSYDWNEQIIESMRYTEEGTVMKGAGPYIVSADGHTYRLMADSNVRVDLEEWNELRLVLRGEGRLVLDTAVPGAPEVPEDVEVPRDLGRCVVRIIAYAGQPFVRLQYAFYFSNLTASSLISDVAVLEKLNFVDHFDAVVDLPTTFRKPIQDIGRVALLKPRPDRYYLISPDAREPELLSGRDEAPNWICAAGEGRGLAVCMRDMQHLFPKELELGSDGVVVAHVWPPHGEREMRDPAGDVTRRNVGTLGFAHYGKMLDLTVPSSYAATLKDREGLFDFDAVRDANLSDHTGTAVTCDMLYIFYSGRLDIEEVSEIARIFQFGPHAVQDRKSLAEAEALHNPLTPDQLRRAGALAMRLLKAEDRAQQQGMFNYQDLHGRWLPDEERWALRGHWLSMRHDVPGMLWTLYLQAGDPDLLRCAERNMAHILAVDFCHDATPTQAKFADPRRRKIVGATGDSRTPIHWQSTWHVNDRFVRLDGPLLAYYLTGNLWARDAAAAWGEAAKIHGTPRRGIDGVAFMNNLRGSLNLRYDVLLHNRLAECADFLFAAPETLPPEAGWTPGMLAYARQFGDARVRTFLSRLASDPAVRGADGSLSRLSLMEDLQVVDPSCREKATKIVADFETEADRLLRETDAPETGSITWEDLAAYVLDAAP